MLIRFRKSALAIVCDIAEMYLRIGIAKEDKPDHRFLWRGNNSNEPPAVYEFDRVVFGVNSSPFQAQYVLRQHAKKYQKTTCGNHFEIYLHGRFHELYAARRPGDRVMQTDNTSAEKGWYACA